MTFIAIWLLYVENYLMLHRSYVYYKNFNKLFFKSLV